MIIDQLNLNALQMFCTVFQLKSMTAASKQLHLTQSAISQNIKSLEVRLQTKLFDRINRKIIATQSAIELYNIVQSTFQNLELFASKLRGKNQDFYGELKIGSPLEFANNIVFKKLVPFLIEHPQLKANIRVGFSNKIVEAVLNGELDLGFVDEFKTDKKIHFQKIHSEELVLVASVKYMSTTKFKKERLSEFNELQFVDYDKSNTVLNRWFLHHYETVPKKINVRAFATNVISIAQLITNNLGAGVLPRHQYESLLNDGNKLHRFHGSGKSMFNTVSIATLKEKSQTPGCIEFMQLFKNQPSK